MFKADTIWVSICVVEFALGVIVGSAVACGPQFDREAMQDVKETFCSEVLQEAKLAQQRGDTLTPEENAAVEFCDD
jgi:hypothetical protein